MCVASALDCALPVIQMWEIVCGKHRMGSKMNLGTSQPKIRLWSIQLFWKKRNT